MMWDDGFADCFGVCRYHDVVRQGDQLITKLQKYGQVVRLRGSERS